MTSRSSDVYGRFYSRVGLVLAWTTTNEGPDAKVCRESGSGSWKQAQPLSPSPDAAAGFFTKRIATRSPVVPAGSNRLVLLDADGAPLEELAARYELALPHDAWRVRTARGTHLYASAPAGHPGLKVELTPERVTVITDGYLLAPPGRHPSGLMYEFENVDVEVEDRRPPGLDETLLERLREIAGRGRERIAAVVDRGGPIDPGDRHAALMHHAARLRGEGLGAKAIRAALEELQGRFAEPTGRHGEIAGIVRWVMAKPAPAPLDPVDVELLAVLNQLPTTALAGKSVARGEAQAGGAGSTRRAAAPTTSLFLPFSDVRVSGPVRWVWRRKIPESAVTLLAGRPKLGKSLFAVWAAAQLSRGLLEGARFGEPAKTLLVAAEDPVDTIVKARLIAAAADEALVGTLASRPPRPPSSDLGDKERNLDGLDGLDGLGTLTRRIVIPDEYELLEQIVVDNELALVVLDPINSFLSHKIDAHRDVEIRRVLDPLAALCARRHIAALAVVHLNRRADTDVLNRITGSGGYGGSARSILTFGRHPENALQRVVASEGNWQREDRSELFEIREVVVFSDAEPDDQTQPALVHVGTTELDSSDLVDQLNEDRSALDQAKDYLYGELAFGPAPVTALRKGAEAHAISWRTVERAKKLLGVEARRVSSETAPRGAGHWEWFLELIEPDEEKES